MQVTETGWNILPEEIQLQVLSYLDPLSLITLAATSTISRSLAQDDQLCEQVCREHYPLAASRKSRELLLCQLQDRAYSDGSWYQHLLNTTVFRDCITSRRSLDYYELATGTELPSSYAQNLGATPRGRHHSRYNFGRLALFFTGVDVFLVVDLGTRQATEFHLPSPFHIRDVYLEEDHVYVLTTRSSIQYVFKYDMKGQVVQSLNTCSNDLVLLMANRRHVLVYSADYQLWRQYSTSTADAPTIDGTGSSIGNTALTSDATSAIDEHYFYQLHEATSVLLIYDLDNKYCVSRISLFSRDQHTRSEVYSINRHCYVCGPGQISYLDGLNVTKANIPGIPHDDDTPMWDTRPLVDLGGWVAWFGDLEEGVMFGAFCVLPSPSGDSGMLDCGRLRGPNEPEDQHEARSVSLVGDQKWIICVMDNRVLVWSVGAPTTPR